MTRPPLRAILLMLVAMTLVPTGDTAAKLLINRHGADPFFVAWSRFAIGTLVAAALVVVTAHPPRLGLFRDWRVWLRALLIISAIPCILRALRTEPVADVFGAFFVGPIVSYALSAYGLREQVTLPRTVLLLLGFAGVLLVVRPGFGMNPGILWAVLAGMLYGCYLAANRWLGTLSAPLDLMLTQLVIGSVVLAPFGLPLLPDAAAPVIGLTLASGLSSMLGNLLLVAATQYAPASRLAPFVYFQLVAATLLGWAVFDDLPDRMALAGLAVIFAAGIATLGLRR